MLHTNAKWLCWMQVIRILSDVWWCFEVGAGGFWEQQYGVEWGLIGKVSIPQSWAGNSQVTSLCRPHSSLGVGWVGLRTPNCWLTNALPQPGEGSYLAQAPFTAWRHLVHCIFPSLPPLEDSTTWSRESLVSEGASGNPQLYTLGGSKVPWSMP